MVVGHVVAFIISVWRRVGSGARTTHAPAKFLPILYDGESLIRGGSVAETQQTGTQTKTNGIEVLETREWLDSLDHVLSHGGPERAGRLLQQLALHARREAGINLPFSATTPYQNTIPSRQQPPFPGSQEMERRIKSLVRWNALAMVVRANKIQEAIGG